MREYLHRERLGRKPRRDDCDHGRIGRVHLQSLPGGRLIEQFVEVTNQPRGAVSRAIVIGERAEFARREQQVVLIDESREVRMLDVSRIEIAMDEDFLRGQFRQDIWEFAGQPARECIDNQHFAPLIEQRVLNEVGHLAAIKRCGDFTEGSAWAEFFSDR